MLRWRNNKYKNADFNRFVDGVIRGKNIGAGRKAPMRS